MGYEFCVETLTKSKMFNKKKINIYCRANFEFGAAWSSVLIKRIMYHFKNNIVPSGTVRDSFVSGTANKMKGCLFVRFLQDYFNPQTILL